MTQSELNSIINSKWLASPLAYNGLSFTELPIPVSPSSVTQKGGFGSDFKVPLTSSGEPVPLEGMNTLFEYATSSLYCHNLGLKKGFIQDECTAIDGYPKGALLWYRVADFTGSRSAGTYNDAQTLRRSVTYQQSTSIKYYDFLVESLIDNNTYNFQSDPLLIDGVNWRALPNQVYESGSYSRDGLNYIYESSTNGFTNIKTQTTGASAKTIYYPFVLASTNFMSISAQIQGELSASTLYGSIVGSIGTSYFFCGGAYVNSSGVFYTTALILINIDVKNIF